MKRKLLPKEIALSALAIGITVLLITAQAVILFKISNLSSAYTIATETESTVSAEKELIQPQAEYKLYECGGKIGIYDAQSDTIIDIIDILVSTLPAKDRYALKKGIEVFSLTELSDLINDFSS